MNRIGANIEPCGTPLVAGAQSEAVPWMTTLCFLLLVQFSIQLFDLERKLIMWSFVKRFFLNQGIQYLKIW